MSCIHFGTNFLSIWCGRVNELESLKSTTGYSVKKYKGKLKFNTDEYPKTIMSPMYVWQQFPVTKVPNPEASVLCNFSLQTLAVHCSMLHFVAPVKTSAIWQKGNAYGNETGFTVRESGTLSLGCYSPTYAARCIQVHQQISD